MVWHFYMAEDEWGQKVGEALGVSLDDVKGLKPLASQTLAEKDLRRLENLGANGSREQEFAGKQMTHCVPNERVAKTDEQQLAQA